MTNQDLMEITHRLVKELGNQWKEIASRLYDKGFAKSDGSPLTVDTVRKRYKRWLVESGEGRKSGEPPAKRKGANTCASVHKPSSPTGRSSRNPENASEAVIPVSELLELFRGSLERRDAILADKMKGDLGARDTQLQIAEVEARLEEKLIGVVQDLVDEELRSMLTPGGSFERDLKSLVSKVIDDKARGRLSSLLGDIDISHDRPAGPGRGYRGSKAARFSATMDGDVYKRMKALEGTFSSHLTSACLLYLSALEQKSEHTE